MSSGAVTFRGRKDDNSTSCIIENSVHNRISVFSTFITDLVLLVLMVVGVLRWKDARRTNGIWLLLYRQVCLSRPSFIQ